MNMMPWSSECWVMGGNILQISELTTGSLAAAHMMFGKASYLLGEHVTS